MLLGCCVGFFGVFFDAVLGVCFLDAVLGVCFLDAVLGVCFGDAVLGGCFGDALGVFLFCLRYFCFFVHDLFIFLKCCEHTLWIWTLFAYSANQLYIHWHCTFSFRVFLSRSSQEKW